MIEPLEQLVSNPLQHRTHGLTDEKDNRANQVAIDGVGRDIISLKSSRPTHHPERSFPDTNHQRRERDEEDDSEQSRDECDLRRVARRYRSRIECGL